MSRAETAHAMMVEHKGNCAQATISVFDNLGLDKETAQKITRCFGGGMATGNICGAITASYMVLGLKMTLAADNPKESHEKVHAQIAEFNKKFITRHGSLLCKVLKAPPIKPPQVCPNLVKSAVEILEGMIKE